MKTNSVSRRVVPFFTAALSAVLFGIATPASKYLLRDIHPFSLAGLLYLGASAGLLPVVIARKEFAALRGMNRANTRRLFGAVILGGIAGPVLLMFGLTQASASSVSLWLNLELVATSVLGYLFFRDYLGKAGWAGVLLALLSGVLLTVSEGRTGVAAAVLVGCACVCWGFDNHFTALIDGISAVQSTFVKGLFAGGITTCIGFSAYGLPPSAMPVACAVALGGVSYGVSIVLYIMSAQKIGAIRSQIVFSSSPFFGFFFSMLLLSEPATRLQVVSFALLVAAIALMALEKHEHYHEHRELQHTHFHRHDDMHHDHVHGESAPYHEHGHRHENGAHVHPHWPDIHHRHEHGGTGKP